MSEKKKEVVIEKSTSESSSVGIPSENDNDRDDEVQSGVSIGTSTLDTMASLEEHLPIKKGLSNYYHGKSKSFANLGNIGGAEDVKEMGKEEHVVNKKRRLIISHKWRANKRASTHGNNIAQQSSMPNLLSDKNEDNKDEHEKE